MNNATRNAQPATRNAQPATRNTESATRNTEPAARDSHPVSALILTGYGLNCDNETAYAFELAGAKAVRVHINTVIAGACGPGSVPDHGVWGRFFLGR